jgi:hypothetical protein
MLYHEGVVDCSAPHDIVRAREVARTVSEPVEVDEELRYLYRILMS